MVDVILLTDETPCYRENMNVATYSGGAPIIADSPALDLSNTIYTPRGHEHDGISTTEHLLSWLRAVEPRLQTGTSIGVQEVSDEDHNRVRALRTSLRRLLYDIADGNRPDDDDVIAVNTAAGLSPQWARLEMVDQQPRRQTGGDAPPIDAVLSALATDAIDLVAGMRRESLRTCQAHNCSLLFIKDHPRREWCSPQCGARVRAARAYARRGETGRR